LFVCVCVCCLFVCLFVYLFSCCFVVCQIKDSELNPVVNRDLSRRVRYVSGINFAKPVSREDIKLAAQLIRRLDNKSAVYEKEKKAEETNGADKEKETEVWRIL